MCFQMTFAIITPALIAGSFADRMKFSAMCVFMVLWSILIYAPIAHIMWQSDGLMFKAGILDFAGGTVVHINAGIAGLVSCLVLGKRMGYPKNAMPPHNLVLSVIGASLLWVGWFGFNAGSALTSGGRAGMAMTTTQVATAAAGIAWMVTEWLAKKKPSVLGIISGAVAGLVAVTPASGFVTPTGALIIGIVAGVLCYFSATALKHAAGYDDSLDAFGVHCIGGIIGALLTGVFAAKSIGGDAAAGLLDGNPGQLWIQIEGVALTLVWSGVGSFILLKIVDMVIGLRVSEDIERDGLDLGLHGETVQ
jgi:Amt family ammonium transporter